MPIQRVTFFKVMNESDLPALLNQYKITAETNKKDGKPYMLACNAYKTMPNPRSQGYNLVAHITFANEADLKYYDEECECHKAFKELAAGKVAPPPLPIMWETS